ncbi:hypothetical protein [Bacillus halotolerans]|uniref:hypothetical protein n=1 Tax=Bacillus halotolerans TaxID=260554 RepID=UPI003F6C7DEA
MRRIMAIINASLKSIFQFKSLIMVYLGIALICTAVIGIVGAKLIIEPASGRIDENTLVHYIGILGYCAAVVLTGINYCVLFSVPLTREKVNKNIESLLATISSIKEIWIAKSIALFLPGFLLGTIIPLFLTLIFSSIYLSSSFVVFSNVWIVLCTYFAVQVIYLCLSLLIHFVGLIGNTEAGNVIATIFLPVFAGLVINLLARHILYINSSVFFISNIGLAVILFIVCIMFRYKFRKEKIILSCQK